MLVNDEDATFARIVGKYVISKYKKLCIVAVYRSLEQKKYCKYLNNIQCEVPVVRCRFRSLQRKIYAKYLKINNVRDKW